VAIKLLRPEVVADPECTRRFLQGARAVSALNHPNIVTIHDIGEDAARGTGIAMECLDGESLRQRLEWGRLAVGEALRIAVEIARGLAACPRRRDRPPRREARERDDHAVRARQGPRLRPRQARRP
jgi:serine/threonine protein kinase